jgi:hypothetical protein
LIWVQGLELVKAVALELALVKELAEVQHILI